MWPGRAVQGEVWPGKAGAMLEGRWIITISPPRIRDPGGRGAAAPRSPIIRWIEAGRDATLFVATDHRTETVGPTAAKARDRVGPRCQRTYRMNHLRLFKIGIRGWSG